MLQVASAPEYQNQDPLPHLKLRCWLEKKYEIIKKRAEKGANIQEESYSPASLTTTGFSFSAKKTTQWTAAPHLKW